MTVERDPPNDEFEAGLERTIQERARQVPPEEAARLALMRRRYSAREALRSASSSSDFLR